MVDERVTNNFKIYVSSEVRSGIWQLCEYLVPQNFRRSSRGLGGGGFRVVYSRIPKLDAATTLTGVNDEFIYPEKIKEIKVEDFEGNILWRGIVNSKTLDIFYGGSFSEGYIGCNEFGHILDDSIIKYTSSVPDEFNPVSPYTGLRVGNYDSVIDNFLTTAPDDDNGIFFPNSDQVWTLEKAVTYVCAAAGFVVDFSSLMSESPDFDGNNNRIEKMPEYWTDTNNRRGWETGKYKKLSEWLEGVIIPPYNWYIDYFTSEDPTIVFYNTSPITIPEVAWGKEFNDLEVYDGIANVNVTYGDEDQYDEIIAIGKRILVSGTLTPFKSFSNSTLIGDWVGDDFTRFYNGTAPDISTSTVEDDTVTAENNRDRYWKDIGSKFLFADGTSATNKPKMYVYGISDMPANERGDTHDAYTDVESWVTSGGGSSLINFFPNVYFVFPDINNPSYVEPIVSYGSNESPSPTDMVWEEYLPVISEENDIGFRKPVKPTVLGRWLRSDLTNRYIFDYAEDAKMPWSVDFTMLYDGLRIDYPGDKVLSFDNNNTELFHNRGSLVDSAPLADPNGYANFSKNPANETDAFATSWGCMEFVIAGRSKQELKATIQRNGIGRVNKSLIVEGDWELWLQNPGFPYKMTRGQVWRRSEPTVIRNDTLEMLKTLHSHAAWYFLPKRQAVLSYPLFNYDEDFYIGYGIRTIKENGTTRDINTCVDSIEWQFGDSPRVVVSTAFPIIPMLKKFKNENRYYMGGKR